MPPVLVYLIGYAGTGKYTIAKELEARIGAVIIDNQLINGAAFTAVKADGVTPLPPRIWAEIRKIREAVFAIMSNIADKSIHYVLTNELFATKGEQTIFNQVQAVAAARKSMFVPVRLTCEKEELLRRVVNPSRRDRQKETDAEALAYRYDNVALLMPDHENLLELDVTHLQPTQAADKILVHAKQLAEKGLEQ